MEQASHTYQASEIVKSLRRVSNFDTEDLAGAQKRMLGVCDDPIESAEHLKSLYKHISEEAVNALPDHLLEELKATADRDYEKLVIIAEFPFNGPEHQLQFLVQQLENAYTWTFRSLYGIIDSGITEAGRPSFGEFGQ